MVWPYIVITLILFSSLVYGAYKVGIEQGIKFVRISRPEAELIKFQVEVTDMLVVYEKNKAKFKEEIMRNAVYKMMPEVLKYIEIKSWNSIERNSTIYELSLLVSRYKK